jgi:hypothetical protein
MFHFSATASTNIIPADLLSSRKSKTQVFSGRRTANRSGGMVED